MDNDNNKEPSDLGSRLEEKNLPKPGAVIRPDEHNSDSASNVTQNTVDAQQDNTDRDIDEFNKFVTSQQNEPEAEEKSAKSGLRILWEIGKTILIAIVVVFVINTFIFQAYYVSGNSMNPDYHDGDYLLINKFPTSMRNIAGFFGQRNNLDLKRGDILVFKPPEAPHLFYIKRILALPGERITLKDGVFKVYNEQNPNGFILKEPYIDSQFKTEGEVDEIISQGNVFMVGDNRSPGGSYDSRAWGQLNQDAISGTAFFRLIPLNNIGFIPLPDHSAN